MPRINPEILRWARESAGLGLEEAARKIELRAARNVSAEDRLSSLERGETEPTRALLVRMAKQYRRSLLAFYLPKPPRKGDRGQDFRTLPERQSDESEAILDTLLRDISTRQELVRAALESEDDTPEPISVIGSVSMGQGVSSVVARLRDALDLSLTELRATQGADAAFKLLRAHVEALGVFVVLTSNLGSHHTTLSVDTFRGVAVADPVAPFIIINDQDARVAWLFTLLHELTHLLLGFTGVSGGAPDRDVERFCNDVASEYLLPLEEFAQISTARLPAGDELAQWIREFASERKVSHSLVAYRLYRQELISRTRWQSLRTVFKREWLAHRDRQKQASKEASGGPNYYIVKRHRLGNQLLYTTARLLASGNITTTKAGQVLGVKPTKVQTLVGGLPSPIVGGR